MTDIDSTVHEKLSVRNDRASKLLVGVASLALATAVLVAALGFFAGRVDHKQWDPLGVWAVQKVTNGPVIHLGHTVNVTAVKCSHENVDSRGTNQWEQVPSMAGGQLGAIVAGTSGINTQAKGCFTFRYKNQIPIAVQSYVELNGPSRWQIAGTTTPYRQSGEVGVPRSWHTQVFTVAP